MNCHQLMRRWEALILRAGRPGGWRMTLQQLLRPKGRRAALGIATAVCIGLACGLGLICSADPRASTARELLLYGRALPNDAAASELARGWIAERLARGFAFVLPGGSERSVDAAALGIELDLQRWERLLVDARHAEGDWQRATSVELAVPLTLDLARATVLLVGLKDELDRVPSDARLDLAVAQNGAETKLYHNLVGKPGLRVKLKGPPGNREGIGAVMRIKGKSGWGPAREVHAGSGYWSQDSAVTVLARPGGAEEIEVRWPGGKRTLHKVVDRAKEIILEMEDR